MSDLEKESEISYEILFSHASIGYQEDKTEQV